MLQGKSISPEDYTTLFGWFTFSWIYPLIKRVSHINFELACGMLPSSIIPKGTYSTLDEGDVWPLSASLQSRPVLIKFNTVRCVPEQCFADLVQLYYNVTALTIN